MRSTRFLVPSLGLLAVLTACDSSPPDEGVDASGGSDAGTTDALECSSFTLCSYAEVTTFATTISPAAGGAISDGMYRLAWVEVSSEAAAGRTRDLMALEIRGGRFIWTGDTQGDLGSLSASGADLIFHYTARCELGAQVNTDDRRFTYGYTATGSELRLHETVSGGEGWEQVWVFVRMEEPGEACELVSSVPSSPGDSAQCTASNCFCTVAVGGLLEESDCPF